MVAGTKSNKTSVRQVAGHAADNRLFAAIFVIVIFGLVMLFSASSVAGYLKSGSPSYFLKHQFFGLLLGVVGFFVGYRFDYHIWRRFSFHFLLASIFLLLLVFIPGLSADYGTARNWINIFGFSLQPAEFVKLSFLLYLAAWLESKKEQFADASQSIFPFLMVLGFISILMLMQPDIGTLAIIGAVSLIVYFVGGGMLKHLMLIVVPLFLVVIFVFNFHGYQLDRLKCYHDPEFSSQEKCYQINQSLIAVGSGGLWGRGVGESRQKFMYLPEVWADSIFAVIAEEIGFIFSLALISLYFYIFYRGYRIAKYAPDHYGRTLAMGIVVLLMVQTFLNIGGITNLIPMTGVPLPFISSGGSSISVMLMSMGILLNISRYTKK